MMNEMVCLKSYAKVNLYLNVLHRMDNGYHSIETIFQTINLFDEIRINRITEPVFRVHCNYPEVPTGKGSIVYRAIEMMMKNEKVKQKNLGLEIFIQKNIPIASGLGGGSSNIATILIGIRRLFDLSIRLSELRDIAIRFGMDIPFFITRGIVYAKGRGEILFPLIPLFPPRYLILINPGFQISTEWAYKAFDDEPESASFKKTLRLDYLVDRKEAIQLSEIHKLIYNCFESTISKKYPVIRKIKEQLKEMGALAVSLSGSGPTMYGLFEKKQDLDKAYTKIKDQYPFVYRTKTIRARDVFFKITD